MQPTALDIKIIQAIAPLQAHPFLVDAADALSENSLVTGFVFALPLFLFWHRSEPSGRTAAQRLIITVLLATAIGGLASILLQTAFRWPPPSSASATAGFYALQFHYNENPNSFPSDSTMLYSAVAFGVLSWNRLAGAGLLAWLLVFVAPVRVFVGGHYPSDIVAGLLLGFFSYRLAGYITRNSSAAESLARSSSPIVLAVLFVWLFEVGKGFADVRQIANALWHIRRHL